MTNTTQTSFIFEATIGDGTPLDLNHWTGTVETQDGHHPVVTHVVGKSNGGGISGWRTRKGAVNYLKNLESSRYPGEESVVLVLRGYPEGDGPAHFTYFAVPLRPVRDFDALREHVEVTRVD